MLLYLREDWVDFIHIWYSTQVPCVVDAYKIAFGSMPNLSNYGNIFLKLYVCGAKSQKKWVDCVHIYVPPALGSFWTARNNLEKEPLQFGEGE